MHYGETERLKQRCVHQQVSDSSGWLMLMHFIFKFNCHDGVESGKEPTWPPARVGEPSYSLKQLQEQAIITYAVSKSEAKA